ncbi:hypothetical protein H8E88_05480, partial [candidate division KSB1 bacterium]|nr:hypothetical protein [candidate division KSB1 bacterium]
MRFKKLLLASAICFMALILVLSPSAFSGTTGKISGFVKDAETGDPLPGVNVYL